MEIISNFKFKLNKNQVLNTLKLHYDSIEDEKANSLYENLLPILYANVNPAAIFEIARKDQDFSLNILKEYNYLVYSILTIGKDINLRIDDFFSHNNIVEGILLDSMSTSYLFQISSELFKDINEKCTKSGLGLSCRISPGDGELPISYQKNIADKLNSKKTIGIYVSDDYLLFPSKSMSYIYGADKSKNLNTIDHNCTKCSHKNRCSMRNDIIF